MPQDKKVLIGKYSKYAKSALAKQIINQRDLLPLITQKNSGTFSLDNAKFCHQAG